MKSKTSIQLPGLSRSTACATKGCHRLIGHLGDHRSTLHAAPSVLVIETPKAALRRRAKARRNEVPPVEVLSFDRYTVLEEDAKVARKEVLRTEVMGFTIVVFDDGTVTSTKSKTQARKARGPKVRNLRYVAPKERLGISGKVGQHRTARRAKAGPSIGRNDQTIKEALGIAV